MRCSTYSTEDYNFKNDTASLYFTLRKWIPLMDIPRGITGRRVKSGALAYTEGKIYALKGHNTNEFWVYDIERDTWREMPPLPDSSRLLKKRTKTKYGCALAYDFDANKIYAFKGGRSQEMYVFNLADSTWQECCTIPKGTIGKGVGRGGSLVYEPISHRLFAIKGENSLEFWSYNPLSDNWEPKPSFPPGAYLKRLGHGSALVAGEGMVYGVKGRGTDEFYGYDVGNNVWRTDLAWVGRPGYKRVKAGGCITRIGSRLYLAIGGNKNEFLSYEIIRDTWLLRDSIPRGTSNRKVKAGAALTASDSVVYLFKGGNRTEFWAYGAYLDLPLPPLEKGIMAEQVVRISHPYSLKIYPSPSDKFLHIKTACEGKRINEVKVFSVDGKLVAQLRIPNGYLLWNWRTKEGRSLPKGIYLFQLEGEKEKFTKKIIKM